MSEFTFEEVEVTYLADLIFIDVKGATITLTPNQARKLSSTINGCATYASDLAKKVAL